MHCRNLITILSVGCLAAAAVADINVYSDGSDGELNVESGQVLTIDLRGAADGNWNDESTSPGSGIYDSAQWAVVFKYSSVNIAGTVQFTNHASGAPVVWLVDGPVTISGTVNLNGAQGHGYTSNRRHSTPGPGGFRGGTGSNTATSGSTGFGPGGARLGDSSSYGSGGSYGSSGGAGAQGAGSVGPVYGNPLILPLIGGSGGSGGRGGSSGAGGGAGGGAILIASSTTITLSGAIHANGGHAGYATSGGGSHMYRYSGGGGSGGAIRLVADSVTGGGHLRAEGGGRYYRDGGECSGAGGVGRIRVEANSINLSDPGSPTFTTGLPGSPVRIWPDEFSPILRVISIDGHPISLDPQRSLIFPGQEVFMSASGTVPLLIQSYNVPPGASFTIRIIRKDGSDSQYGATLLDPPEAGIWQADVTIPNEISAVQVRAVLP